MKRSLLIGALFGALLPFQAVACEEYYEVDNAQAKQLVATLKDSQADEFDQVLAFDTLICAKRVALRDIALRYGRTAASPSVRAQVLKSRLFQFERIVITFLRQEGLSKAQIDFIRRSPAANWPVTGRHSDRNCLSLYSDRCGEDAIQIIGNQVQLNYNEWNGTFSLGDDGRLTGIYWNDKWKDEMLPLPAEIILQ